MLYAFGFDRVGVVVADLYFVDPDPEPGQEGPEQGVRIEVRLLDRPPLRGGIYSAQPIAVDRPIWRADLLESVDNPGSLDRAHHHPRFAGWDPCPRVFTPELSADPVEWVGTRLSDLDGLLAAGAMGAEIVVGPGEADALRAVVPEILDAVDQLLDRVRSAGPDRLGAAAPSADGADTSDAPAANRGGARVSWL